MTTVTPQLDQIHALLADKGYEVAEVAANVLAITDTESKVIIRAVLEGEILFFSLTCTTVPAKVLTTAMLRTMLNSDNGISTSHFQLYNLENGEVAITLNNFCKLQDLGPEDEDDILSCTHFLFVDVLHARDLLNSYLQ